MKNGLSTIGLCFSSRQLYYSIKKQEENQVSYIGSYDFNFNVSKAIRTQHPDTYPAIIALINRLKQKYQFGKMNISTIPDHECWSVVPRQVFKDSSEREAYLSILMKGVDRSELSVNWFDLSNRDFKMAVIRNTNTMKGFLELSKMVSDAEFYSSLEIGAHWLDLKKEKGSIMMIHCYPGLVAVSSYLLGKLRGATYIQFDDVDDLGYLWRYYENTLKWMSGLYEHVYFFGNETESIKKTISSQIDASAQISQFETLEQIGVDAPEKTYGFSLNAAFPAILLSKINS